MTTEARSSPQPARPRRPSAPSLYDEAGVVGEGGRVTWVFFGDSGGVTPVKPADINFLMVLR